MKNAPIEFRVSKVGWLRYGVIVHVATGLRIASFTNAPINGKVNKIKNELMPSLLALGDWTNWKSISADQVFDLCRNYA